MDAEPIGAGKYLHLIGHQDGGCMGAPPLSLRTMSARRLASLSILRDLPGVPTKKRPSVGRESVVIRLSSAYTGGVCMLTCNVSLSFGDSALPHRLRRATCTNLPGNRGPCMPSDNITWLYGVAHVGSREVLRTSILTAITGHPPQHAHYNFTISCELRVLMSRLELRTLRSHQYLPMVYYHDRTRKP